MAEISFAELLSIQVDTVERPKSFPIGPYSSIVTGHEYGKSSQKETPFVLFWCKLLGPLEGVDEDQFEDAGGVEELAARKPIKLTFYLTPDAYYRLREFLEDTLDLNCSGRTFDVVIPEATNVSFIADIKHDAGKKPGEVYMNIDSTAKAA